MPNERLIFLHSFFYRMKKTFETHVAQRGDDRLGVVLIVAIEIFIFTPVGMVSLSGRRWLACSKG